MNTIENNKKEVPLQGIDKDVLGLEKNKNINSTTNAKPQRIFIVLGIIVIIAIAYWILTS